MLSNRTTPPDEEQGYSREYKGFFIDCGVHEDGWWYWQVSWIGHKPNGERLSVIHSGTADNALDAERLAEAAADEDAEKFASWGWEHC